MIRVTMIFVEFKKYKYIRNVKIYEGNINVMVYRILKVKCVLQHLFISIIVPENINLCKHRQGNRHF